MKKAGFFLMTFFLAFLVAWVLFGARLGGVWVILIGLGCWLLLSFLLWQARKLKTKTLLFIGFGLFLALFWPTSSIIESERYYHYRLPQPFLSIVDILVYACFLLSLVVAAALLSAGVKMIQQGLTPAGDAPAEKPGSWLLALVFGLAGLLLLQFFRNLSELLMWDNTNDPIEVFWLILPILTCLVCGTVLAASQSGRAKLVSLVFFLFIPIMMYIIFVPAVNIDFRTITRERGERITYALETYRQREGEYPQRLTQLTPRDLRIIRPPFIFNGQNWCYDSGGSSYLLGYVDRDHWSSPCYVGQVVSSAGDISSLPPVCASQVKELMDVIEDSGIDWCK